MLTYSTENFDKFLSGELAVKCPTPFDAIKLMAMLKANSIRWSDGSRVRMSVSTWVDYEEHTTYSTNKGGLIYGTQSDFRDVPVVKFCEVCPDWLKDDASLTEEALLEMMRLSGIVVIAGHVLDAEDAYEYLGKFLDDMIEEHPDDQTLKESDLNYTTYFDVENNPEGKLKNHIAVRADKVIEFFLNRKTETHEEEKDTKSPKKEVTPMKKTIITAGSGSIDMTKDAVKIAASIEAGKAGLTFIKDQIAPFLPEQTAVLLNTTEGEFVLAQIVAFGLMSTSPMHKHEELAQSLAEKFILYATVAEVGKFDIGAKIAELAKAMGINTGAIKELKAASKVAKADKPAE